LQHLQGIRAAVAATHKATILVTELLNMHLRRKIAAAPDSDLGCFFDNNWLLNAYNAVTMGKRKVHIDPELQQTLKQCMPPFDAPDRTGIQQCLLYDARNLVTVAANNVWMHFHKRVLSHVRGVFALSKDAYAALTRDERKRRKLELMQIAADVCKKPTDAYQSPPSRHEWVTAERRRLRIDAAVGDWDDKPLLSHMKPPEKVHKKAKAKTHRFLYAMMLMSQDREARGGKAFALYPLRHSYVPRHARFDQKAIRDLFFGKSDYIKEKAKKRRLAAKEVGSSDQPTADDDLELPPLQPDGVGMVEECTDAQADDATKARQATSSTQQPKRRNKEQMYDENKELFDRILDLRAAGVARRRRFDFMFTTDGVCARLQMRTAGKTKKGEDSDTLQSMPKRGIWAIDELKRASRLDQLRVVGIDPGKRELVVGVDMDNPKGSAVRYTQRQRERDLRTRQYADEGTRGKPQSVKDAEAGLAGFHSRASNLQVFCAYCDKRHESLDECLAFYADLGHRKRRWKRVMKEQKSEERLFRQLEAVVDPDGRRRRWKYKKQKEKERLQSVETTKERTLVLAYGSWGMIAGRQGAACNRGNPPCIGVGLMRKLSKRFVVAPTPEAYTSKTCCRCLGPCGPWAEKEAAEGKSIRGLRRCTQRDDCMIPLNRDKCGATNIGTNFKRLFEDRSPIRSMSDEDLAFHRANMCLECS
jgi:hypothetical protein